MTEIEDTLSRVLAAQADRHEPPVFDAHRIAEAAAGRRRVSRRVRGLPLFAVVAAAIGTAGVGGALALSAGGGQHRLADQVTVTFQSKTGTVGPDVTDESAELWVRVRAAHEGLKDVTVTVRHSPWRLEVTGHAADLSALKTIGQPGILQFRPTASVPTPAPAEGSPTQPCQVSAVKTGTAWLACVHTLDGTTVDGIDAYWVTDPVSADFRVVSAQSLLFSPTGWGVTVTLDPSGVKALADYSAQFAKKPLAVMIDGAVATSMTFGPPITDGKFGFEAGSTRAQAALLAGFLETQGPADLEGAIVSVSTR